MGSLGESSLKTLDSKFVMLAVLTDIDLFKLNHTFSGKNSGKESCNST
jgi:hypothetical protein